MKLGWLWGVVFVLLPVIQMICLGEQRTHSRRTPTKARKKTKSRPSGMSLTDVMWQGYDPVFRPGELDGGGVTVIDFSLGIEDIVFVNEGTMGASVNFLATVSMSWDDPRLSWSTEDVPRQKLHIPALKLWMPDIRLVNNLEPQMVLDYKVRATILSTGRVSVEVPAQLLVHCGRPRDSRANWECLLPFASWSYDSNELGLNLVGGYGAELANYDDRVWLITGTAADKAMRNSGGVDHSEVNYSIKILRR